MIIIYEALFFSYAHLWLRKVFGREKITDLRYCVRVAYPYGFFYNFSISRFRRFRAFTTGDRYEIRPFLPTTAHDFRFYPGEISVSGRGRERGRPRSVVRQTRIRLFCTVLGFSVFSPFLRHR